MTFLMKIQISPQGTDDGSLCVCHAWKDALGKQQLERGNPHPHLVSARASGKRLKRNQVLMGPKIERNYPDSSALRLLYL